ncbi:hypothetical protein IDH50_16000 [Aeromicrobium tamlense]|uniref:Lipoprotein n=1 Tax=Aeromicrobium tamlense TaxID=375541 RepID=A0A8I0KN13_9ACTN|nr:hypothetical protein [Aeromicrobium tamlense]MBD1271748.1 hypothetical protein [Aeromicrobium tamlense]NYI37504.1 hypothetical protein [Aeromicrobium tamlense]
MRTLPALLIALALAGCGGKEITAGDATVLVGERSSSGADALGGGTLELVGGCLGADGIVVIWPVGTDVVDEDPLTIDIPHLGELSLGDRVEVPGGMVLEHSSDTVPPGPLSIAGVTVPESCAEHDVFLARRGG